jgi:hypothetical protein
MGVTRVSTRSGFSVFGQNREPKLGTPVPCFRKPEPGDPGKTGVPVTGRFRLYPVQ